MRVRTALALFLIALLLPACKLTATGDESAPEAEAPEPAATVDLNQSEDAPPASEAADVVERVLPSVVNVRVEALTVDRIAGIREGEGQGSGVVIDRDGVILTNAHVIAGATRVRVVFNDGIHEEPLDGEVIGAVPERDLAVIKVEADDLRPIRIGRSTGMRLGDPVIAIGFPLGLGGPTVTQGIVSGLDRTIDVEGQVVGAEVLEGLIQTDAAINPGNSGGALIDFAGRLVGINTAAAQAASAENIGFAIGIDGAVPVVEEIVTKPPEKRAWLGVVIDEVGSSVEAVQAGFPSEARGALVVDLFPEGPALEAGLRPGELIVRVGDEEITSAEALTRALTGFEPGDRVEVEILSPGGGSRTVGVVLEERPAGF